MLYKKRYNNFFYPSSKQKRQNGVAIYTKYNPTSLIHGFNSSFDNEGWIQKIGFDKFNLYNVYFLLGATKESLKSKFEFYDLFMRYVNKSNKPQIICGDFNRIVSELEGYNLDLLKKNNEFSSRKRKMVQWFSKLWIYKFFQIILIKNQKIILGGHIVEIQEGKIMNIG